MFGFPIPPRTIEDYTQALREFLMDHPELNHILLDRDDGSNQDFVDRELAFAIHQALNKINMHPPVTGMDLSDFPSETHWTLLLDFGVIRILEAKGILKTRNEMPYQDQGGISVDFRGKAQEYRIIVDRFYARAYEELANMKREMSVRAGYGDVPSAYRSVYPGW